MINYCITKRHQIKIEKALKLTGSRMRTKLLTIILSQSNSKDLLKMLWQKLLQSFQGIIARETQFTNMELICTYVHMFKYTKMFECK